jgi:hypothetical protein
VAARHLRLTDNRCDAVHRMADDSIHLEYNRDLHALEALLSGVRRAGDFFVATVAEIPMPGIEIGGVGVLSFPVPPSQIAALVRKATRAPYGRRRETILDELVRKVWEVPPQNVRIGGRWGQRALTAF